MHIENLVCFVCKEQRFHSGYLSCPDTCEPISKRASPHPASPSTIDYHGSIHGNFPLVEVFNIENGKSMECCCRRNKISTYNTPLISQDKKGGYIKTAYPNDVVL